MESFWEQVSGEALRQGDYLLNCPVAILDPRPDASEEVVIQETGLIVMTQSCDLENQKTRFVALCPLFSLREFEQANPGYARKGEWENVRKGRTDGLQLLSSPTAPADNRSALVVDFREIYSLPFEFLVKHAEAQGLRWRLKSPYLEHFSQAFARFFMHVGLPSSIPPYR